MVLHIVKNIMEGKDETIKDPEMPLSRGSFNLFQPQVISLDQYDCHGIVLYIKAVEIIHDLVLEKQKEEQNFCSLTRGSALFQLP